MVYMQIKQPRVMVYVVLVDHCDDITNEYKH